MQRFWSFNFILATSSSGSSLMCGGGSKMWENLAQSSESRVANSSSIELVVVHSFSDASMSGSSVSRVGAFITFSSTFNRLYGGIIVVTRWVQSA